MAPRSGSLALVVGLLAAVATAARAQSPAPQPAASAPVDAIARVNGEELSREAFREWMVRTHGWRHFDDYVTLALLRQEARRTGVPVPTDDDIEAAFEADWHDQIVWRHRGEEAGFLKELAESGLDRQGYRDRRLGTLEQEVVAERILRARPPTEQERKELWNREFGPQGTRTHVRIAFFDKLKLLKPGDEADRATVERSGQDAKAAAEAFQKSVAADRAQFAAQVRSASDHCAVPRHDGIPVDLRSRGGELPRLRPDHFGGQLVKPLANAKAGDLLGPIETPQGFFVIEVIARGPAPFDAVQDELAEIWRTRDPSQGEVHWLKEELRKAATIARFPLNPSGRQ